MVVPSIEPTQFYAGDTVAWSRSIADFPASGGWTLAYKLANKDQSVPVDPGDVTADGDIFQIVIPAAESANLNPGTYQLVGYVTDGTNRYIVAAVTVRILQNPAVDGEPYDPRSQNQRTYDNICAMIEGRDIDEEHTMPDGRSLKRMPIKDLIFWQQVYAARLMKERGTLSEFVGVRFQ